MALHTHKNCHIIIFFWSESILYPLYEKKNAIKYRLFLEYKKQNFTKGVAEKYRMMLT
ncbi:hypothetical protein OIU74_013728 [Salix koriyanagi]|uniref:Uncharacterized protein n=1 Tax=Salix koriyanagi TaxID=2511006 RepID=A0A9Q0T600_9ROSI|nr:hypothetical protein OIU74_013728 [Salix koriyanagi]